MVGEFQSCKKYMIFPRQEGLTKLSCKWCNISQPNSEFGCFRSCILQEIQDFSDFKANERIILYIIQDLPWRRPGHIGAYDYAL